MKIRNEPFRVPVKLGLNKGTTRPYIEVRHTTAFVAADLDNLNINGDGCFTFLKTPPSHTLHAFLLMNIFSHAPLGLFRVL